MSDIRIELKDCPCGHDEPTLKFQIYLRENEPKTWGLACPKCKVKIEVIYKSPKEAIRAWNQRVEGVTS